MSTGVLSIRQKEQTAEDAFGIAPQAAGSKYVTRTPTYKARQDDLQVESLRRAKLKDYDKFLKSFQYTSALDAVLGSVSIRWKESGDPISDCSCYRRLEPITRYHCLFARGAYLPRWSADSVGWQGRRFFGTFAPFSDEALAKSSLHQVARRDCQRRPRWVSINQCCLLQASD